MDSLENINGGVVTPPADGCNHEKRYDRYSENATCCKEGIIAWYCEDCGYEYEEILPVVPHEFQNGYCLYCNMSEEEYNGGEEGEIVCFAAYKDEEFYFEIYSDNTFVGTACQNDINMDGKLDECDRNEIRGNWMLSEDQSVLVLNDDISGQTFTFKVTAEGEIYR